MKTEFILASIRAVHDAIIASESEIESLDREIGDGDHFINMKRGCVTLLGMQEAYATLPPDEVLQQIGMKLLSTIGGASGPLIASFFMAMAKTLKAHGGETLPQVALAFSSGVQAIQQRGKAGLGEKTMLDVLIPVSLVFTQLTERASDSSEIFEVLKTEAEKGMLATRELIATKGRAAFLGERARGHIDPGAKSSQVIICTICNLALNKNIINVGGGRWV